MAAALPLLPKLYLCCPLPRTAKGQGPSDAVHVIAHALYGRSQAQHAGTTGTCSGGGLPASLGRPLHPADVACCAGDTILMLCQLQLLEPPTPWPAPPFAAPAADPDYAPEHASSAPSDPPAPDGQHSRSPTPPPTQWAAPQSPQDS